jgi:hypothetical protein
MLSSDRLRLARVFWIVGRHSLQNALFDAALRSLKISAQVRVWLLVVVVIVVVVGCFVVVVVVALNVLRRAVGWLSALNITTVVRRRVAAHITILGSVAHDRSMHLVGTAA